MFFNRRKMRKFLSGNGNSDEMDGVRIGIPFDAVTEFSRQIHASTLPIVNLTLSTPVPAVPAGKPNGAVPLDAPPESKQSIQFAFHKLDEHWDQLDKLVRDVIAKRQPDSAPLRPVIIDFGLGGAAQTANGEGTEDTRSKQQVICEMLAIDYTPDVFGSSLVNLLCTAFLTRMPQSLALCLTWGSHAQGSWSSLASGSGSGASTLLSATSGTVCRSRAYTRQRGRILCFAQDSQDTVSPLSSRAAPVSSSRSDPRQ